MDVDGAPSATANGNGIRQKRIKAPWKQAVVKILEMNLVGTDKKLDLVEAGPEKMLANLAEWVVVNGNKNFSLIFDNLRSQESLAI